jgi:tetratricopeptide (TPR) repeat protein
MKLSGRNRNEALTRDTAESIYKANVGISREKAMTEHRRPNQRLRDALGESGWTGRELAAAINTAASESGIRLTYDRTSVAHWLTGTAPRPPAGELISEVLSRRLGRPIASADLGLDPAARGRRPSAAEPAGPGPRQEQTVCPPGGLVEAFASLNALQAGRRKALAGATYSLAALTLSHWPLPRAADERPPGLRVAPEAIGSAEAMARMFSTMDVEFGGGSARRALAGYLTHDLGPKLRAPAAPATRRGLHTVAAQLSYLCGFMCFDDELHGVAQRYFGTALRLAADNDDAATRAMTLRALSVQAQRLGHFGEAVDLAESAVSAGGGRADPLRRAFLYGQLAVARASYGDRTDSVRLLGQAEAYLGRATSRLSLTVGVFHHAALAHQQAVLRSALGDRAGAISALSYSIRHRPRNERRSYAILCARRAELLLGEGRLEEAAESWHAFLDAYPELRSGRADSALKNMRASVRPYSAVPAAKALLRRANEFTATSSTAR